MEIKNIEVILDNDLNKEEIIKLLADLNSTDKFIDRMIVFEYFSQRVDEGRLTKWSQFLEYYDSHMLD